MDLDTFLSLSQQEISNIIINYLTEKKISRQYKIVIFPIYEAHYESEIRDSLDTVGNPFEESSIFMSVGKRKKKNRLNKYQDEDPEIEAERKKGNVVNSLYDSK